MSPSQGGRRSNRSANKAEAEHVADVRDEAPVMEEALPSEAAIEGLSDSRFDTPPNAAARAQVAQALQGNFGNSFVRRLMSGGSSTDAPAYDEDETLQEVQDAQGGGQALPEATRAEMEPAFGRDLQDVRLHTDGHADALSRDLRAKAFTAGNDIFFREGAYDPSSDEGRQTLAHELTHVAQQSGSGTSPSAGVSSPTDASEVQAEAVAEDMTAEMGTGAPDSGALIHREPEDPEKRNRDAARDAQAMMSAPPQQAAASAVPGGLAGLATQGLSGLAGGVGGLAGQAAQGIGGAVGGALGDQAESTPGGLAGMAAQGLGGMTGGLTGLAGQAAQGIGGAVGGALGDQANSAPGGLAGMAAQGLGGMTGGLTGLAGQAAQGIGGAVGGALGDQANSAPGGLAGMAAQGLGGMTGGLTGLAGQAAQGMGSAVGGALGGAAGKGAGAVADTLGTLGSTLGGALGLTGGETKPGATGGASPPEGGAASGGGGAIANAVGGGIAGATGGAGAAAPGGAIAGAVAGASGGSPSARAGAGGGTATADPPAAGGSTSPGGAGAARSAPRTEPAARRQPPIGGSGAGGGTTGGAGGAGGGTATRTGGGGAGGGGAAGGLNQPPLIGPSGGGAGGGNVPPAAGPQQAGVPSGTDWDALLEATQDPLNIARTFLEIGRVIPGIPGLVMGGVADIINTYQDLDAIKNEDAPITTATIGLRDAVMITNNAVGSVKGTAEWIQDAATGSVVFAEVDAVTAPLIEALTIAKLGIDQTQLILDVVIIAQSTYNAAHAATPASLKTWNAMLTNYQANLAGDIVSTIVDIIDAASLGGANAENAKTAVKSGSKLWNVVKEIIPIVRSILLGWFGIYGGNIPGLPTVDPGAGGAGPLAPATPAPGGGGTPGAWPSSGPFFNPTPALPLGTRFRGAAKRAAAALIQAELMKIRLLYTGVDIAIQSQIDMQAQILALIQAQLAEFLGGQDPVRLLVDKTNEGLTKLTQEMQTMMTMKELSTTVGERTTAIITTADEATAAINSITVPNFASRNLGDDAGILDQAEEFLRQEVLNRLIGQIRTAVDGAKATLQAPVTMMKDNAKEIAEFSKILQDTAGSAVSSITGQIQQFQARLDTCRTFPDIFNVIVRTITETLGLGGEDGFDLNDILEQWRSIGPMIDSAAQMAGQMASAPDEEEPGGAGTAMAPPAEPPL